MMNPTMNKTLENVQQLSKEWGAYSRRMSRDALRAMSGQLESAARYLDDLSQRLDEHLASHAEPVSDGHAPEAEGSEPSDSAN
jgi:hypothetical protein